MLVKVLRSLVLVSLAFAQDTSDTSKPPSPDVNRPTFQVPNLTQVRSILALLEAPIISTIVQRAALPVESSLYADSGNSLLKFVSIQEQQGQQTGRYDYGNLEYPYTLPIIAPDHVSKSKTFPPGQFHQDTFTTNKNLTAFFLQDLVPLLQAANKATGSTSPFFHLSNSSATTSSVKDITAKYSLDYQLLALLAHRSSIGKVVAESKYLGAPDQFTPLIKAKDIPSIRTLLVNTTQEQVVLDQAKTAAQALASAWEVAQGADSTTSSAFVSAVQNAVAKTFRNLIDVTTEGEVQYLLQRFN